MSNEITIEDVDDDQAIVIPGAPDEGADRTPRGRALAIERKFNGMVAQLGNEVFLLDGGRWKKQTGFVRRAILNWWGHPADKAGQWDACLEQFAVDPNNDAESVYYERGPGEDWTAHDASVNDVYFSNGLFNVITGEFRRYPLGKLYFGPIMHCEYKADMMAAIKAGDFTKAPQKFVGLLSMIRFAMNDDAPTVKYFQSVVGQILRPHAGWNHFVHVFGESGARKTTILRALLSAPCGKYGFNEMSESALAENKWARQGLLNKIANLSNDSAATAAFVPFIKEVTSGVITTEKKFHDPIPVKLTAKLFATMNTPQRYDDDSLGIENRLIVFKFKERTDNDRSAQGCQWMDGSFYDEETRCWLTHWLLVGLTNCVVNGVERPPEASPLAAQWKEELLNDASGARQFLKKYVVKDREGFISSNRLVDLAIELGYCGADERSRQLFSTKVGGLIKQRFGIPKSRKLVDQVKTLGFAGVRLDEFEP